ncbi:gephyrin-like molybdotransferase Glp [Stappia sp. 28M-7]|uniref:molybdopterin molybdotransferase MoeA n=1 Tax=Stappia sp. 28M-7 TaxID=2762596 RepID=UPI00163BDED1|nr:gephyrin-like molybdotransferase Glp [Stappia sp. 28M-7]MBC2859257.1 molybdopterin molybdotransferase MoeA [Stappia sp. 28M-7]
MAPTRRLLDDCFLHDRDRLRHAEALAILRERIVPVVGQESVALGEAHARILARSVVAAQNVPLADNSAVDGYAFLHDHYLSAGDGLLPISARIAAGHPLKSPLAPGSAARIFTGALMPDGADTVVMQEDCEITERGGQTFVHVPPGLKPGANRRKAGEDLKAGEVLVQAGARLRPQDIAAIASTGAGRVDVFRRLRVALVSSGDELRRPGQPLPAGGVYDSNHFLLSGLVAASGVEITDLGILPDRAEAVQAALSAAALTHDVIVTTGGASRGEEDHFVAAIDELGSRHMWQLAIKPGRPMNFGRIGDCVTLGLPGNPVAAMVCGLLYVLPVLSALGGGAFFEPVRYQIPAAFSVPKKKPDRREFYRGILESDSAGRTVVRKFARDGSGLITSLREADGLIEIPEEATSVVEGQLVDFISFGDYGLAAR